MNKALGFFIVTLFAVLTQRCEAAVALRIDTSAKTFTWLGSYTTPSLSFLGNEGGSLYFDTNPALSIEAPSDTFTTPGSGLTIGDSSGVIDTNNTFADQFKFRNSDNSFWLCFALMQNNSSLAQSATFTTASNGLSYSYAGMFPYQIANFEALDGASLSVIRYRTSTDSYEMIGTQGSGGTIEVVPEPSTYALLALGGAIVVLRIARRRTC